MVATLDPAIEELILSARKTGYAECLKDVTGILVEVARFDDAKAIVMLLAKKFDELTKKEPRSMPEVREYFPHIDSMDIGALHERRAEIISLAPDDDTNRLPDDLLAELLQIGRTLRRKAAAPGGVGRSKKPKSETTLSDLA